MLREHPEITAIVTHQQLGVNRILKVIQSKNLRIPEDISVIGILNKSISEMITPPLTTINFTSHDMGYEAADKIDELMMLTDISNQINSNNEVLVENDGL